MARKKAEGKENLGPKIKKLAKEAKKLAAEVPTAGHNLLKMDPKKRELARHHRDKLIVVQAAVKAASKRMRNLVAEIKSDGLSVRQIKLMVALSTPEGEAAWKATIADDLMAAQYQGAAVGQQLTLFLEPDRTPSSDIAYDAGVQASMDGKPCNPDYDPSVPQYASFIKGFQDDQERRLKAGIQQLEPDSETQLSRAETLSKNRESTSDQLH